MRLMATCFGLQQAVVLGKLHDHKNADASEVVAASGAFIPREKD